MPYYIRTYPIYVTVFALETEIATGRFLIDDRIKSNRDLTSSISWCVEDGKRPSCRSFSVEPTLAYLLFMYALGTSIGGGS
jgi:hypothetical protein